MMRLSFASRRACICLALQVLPIGTWAALADPLDVEAATPSLEYRSPLSAYQGLRDEPLQNWREANDRVGRIGGWRTYALEPWEEPAGAGAPAEPDGGHDHHGDH